MTRHRRTKLSNCRQRWSMSTQSKCRRPSAGSWCTCSRRLRIGLLLSRYKSGKLPKPFKILPTVPHWEDILAITRPDKWTPNACYEATKIFISSTPAVSQRFLEMIMLDRVREDIHETKKLNVHLFKAL